MPISSPIAGPAGERRHRARQGPSLQALYFDLPGLRLCLPLDPVRKVLALMDLQEMPGTQRHLVGLLNLGGEAVPVIDLALRLRRPAFSYHADTPVLLCKLGQRQCGLIVERVQGVRSIDNRQRHVGEVVRDVSVPFLTVFDSEDGLVFMLDIDAIVADLPEHD